jgi:hypothetical protein
VDYQLSDEHADWPERYGAWANGLREMRELVIVGATDETMRHIVLFPEVEILSIRSDVSDPITPQAASAIVGFDKLEYLSLTGGGFTDEAIAEILSARPPLSTALELIETGAGRRTLEEVSQLPLMYDLIVGGHELSDDAFRGLPPLMKLHFFSAAGVGDQAVEWAMQSPHLCDVSLAFTDITDEGVCRLCESADLTVLRLHHADVTGEALRSLGELNQLSALGLVDCPNLTAADIAQLPKSRWLRHVELSAELITEESFHWLRGVIDYGSCTIYGDITDPELRQLIAATPGFRVQDAISETRFWELAREGRGLW